MTIVDDRPETVAPAPRRRPNRLLALLRNSWRQLTSMRTALILLFLLAVAAIPGSVLPQRGISPEKVNQYFVDHPDWAPRLDRIGAFEVFGSVWFSAIYLLLFTSLIGCITPRLRDHFRALRSRPPAAPKRMARLPQHAVLPAPPGGVEAIAEVLRKRRWRVEVRGNQVSAEKGYLKETGNLLFHTSLIAVLIGVGLGSWYGWSGNRLLVAGADNSFCNTRQQYAEAKLGPRVNSADLPRFCLRLDDFQARFLDSGQPEFFNATVTVDGPDEPTRSANFSVNAPLRLNDASVYLLGHGYAPVIRYTDRFGNSQISDEPFLTTGDMGLTSEGLAAFPDANVDPGTGKRAPDEQMAFTGIYLPTAPEQPPMVRSQYPTERNPVLNLVAYRGNLGLDAGIPTSIYKLDQRQVRTGKVKEVGTKLLRKGETWTLDDGTTVEFLGTERYVTLSIRHDPGATPLLISCGFLLVGLMGSLFGRRRRVWFRVISSDPAEGSPTGGSSLVEAGGLPRTDYPGFAEEFAQLVAAVSGADRPAAGADSGDRAGVREGAE
ncbi:cytochrome c biogenesis protein ResB [Micromonospora arborensis]|uniref:cytochrome c biogenesis protein ResB n=1 Tax=Micromonospora arborensis TaxID=2116518 RepID=UPI003418679F